MPGGGRINWQAIAEKFINTMERARKYINVFLVGLITGVGSVLAMASLASGEALGALVVLGGVVLASVIILTD